MGAPPRWQGGRGTKNLIIRIPAPLPLHLESHAYHSSRTNHKIRSSTPPTPPPTPPPAPPPPPPPPRLPGCPPSPPPRTNDCTTRRLTLTLTVNSKGNCISPPKRHSQGKV